MQSEYFQVKPQSTELLSIMNCGSTHFDQEMYIS
jgi:hypothetical protein